RRAGVEEAGRGPPGQGQGRGRILGRARQAGPDPVRARWRPRPACGRSIQPRGDEAADQDQGRRPSRRHLASRRRMMAATKKSAKAAKPATGGNRKFEDLRTKTDDQLSEQLVELKREQFNL